MTKWMMAAAVVIALSSGGVSAAPDSAKDICPAKIGSKLPDVTVKNINGENVKLLDAVKNKPTVLIYYRGGWCPFCNTQLGQLQTVTEDLEKLGYQIVGISPDIPAKQAASIEKNKLTYTLLSDSEMKSAEALGIAFRMTDEALAKYKGYKDLLETSSGQKHHLLPVPSVFIVNTEGTIKFAYVNPDYTIRLDPDVLLAAAKAYK